MCFLVLSFYFTCLRYAHDYLPDSVGWMADDAGKIQLQTNHLFYRCNRDVIIGKL